MKLLIASMLLLASVASFATTCFEAKSLPADLEGLPQVTCVNNVSLKLVIPALPKTPYYQLSVKTNSGEIVQDAVIFRKEGNNYKVVASKVISEVSGGSCEYASIKLLSYSVLVDSSRNVVPGSLTVEGVFSETYDTCHSDDQVTTVKYSKI